MAKVKGALTLTDLPTDDVVVEEAPVDTEDSPSGPLTIASNDPVATNSKMKELLAQVMVTPEQQKKDELLAWSGGLTDPSGDIGNSLISANAAQSKYRLEDRKLRAQYTVPIMNALAASQPAAQIPLDFRNMTEEQVAQASIAAKRDLLPFWKQANFGEKLEGDTYSQGRDPKTGQVVKTWNLSPKTGLNVDKSGNVSVAPGADTSQAQIAGSVAEATEKAKAGWNQVTVYGPDNTPYTMFQSQANPQLFAKDPKGTGAAQLPPNTKITPAGPAAAPTAAPPGGAGTGVQGTPENANLPLGIRNNNPGNLKVPGKDEFQKFGTMQEGLQALDNQLAIYGKRDKIDTVEGVISKWAPPSENNTKAYIARAQALLGVKPGEKIDLSNPLVRQAMSAAITLHENGSITKIGGGGAAAPVATGAQPAPASPAAAARPGVPTGAIQSGASPVVQMQQQQEMKDNEEWTTNVLRPVRKQRDVAQNDILPTIRLQRQALSQTGTGFGQDAINAGAKILSAFGVADAENIAKNADVFRSTLKTQVFAGLAPQNGVQTEGDATRMEQTFANMKNEAEANKLILDLAEARAQRDILRGNFYEKKIAEGIPRQQIEKSWNEIMPSIYKVGPMQKYPRPE